MQELILLHVLFSFDTDVTPAPPAYNRGTTGPNRDIIVDNLGNTGLYRHEPWLYRKFSVVNLELTGARFLIDQGYVGTVRTQIIF